jgi:hypothetical protein
MQVARDEAQQERMEVETNSFWKVIPRSRMDVDRFTLIKKENPSCHWITLK